MLNWIARNELFLRLTEFKLYLCLTELFEIDLSLYLTVCKQKQYLC